MNPSANAGDTVDSGSVPESGPREEEMTTTLMFLPRKSHEQRKLAGYSP